VGRVTGCERQIDDVASKTRTETSKLNCAAINDLVSSIPSEPEDFLIRGDSPRLLWKCSHYGTEQGSLLLRCENDNTISASSRALISRFFSVRSVECHPSGSARPCRAALALPLMSIAAACPGGPRCPLTGNGRAGLFGSISGCSRGFDPRRPLLRRSSRAKRAGEVRDPFRTWLCDSVPSRCASPPPEPPQTTGDNRKWLSIAKPVLACPLPSPSSLLPVGHSHSDQRRSCSVRLGRRVVAPRRGDLLVPQYL
jgi:hypothetical protein